MNQLINQPLIDERKLDQGNYFRSLLKEACNKNILANDQFERIQYELYDLLAKQVDRYTNSESSSVRTEKAQQIFQSICYSIGIHLKSVSDSNTRIDLLKKEKISVLYFNGINQIISDIAKANSMLVNLQSEMIKVDNYAYDDTILRGIPVFFHDYDYEFSAYDDPGSIDYPLCNDITKKSGIEFISEYLLYLTEENIFCKKFPDANIEKLLRGYSDEYMHVLVNIYELILTNALGCEILGKSVTDLYLDSDDRELLQKKLEKLNIVELQVVLWEAYEKICFEIDLEEKIATDYVKEAIHRLAIRLRQNLKIGVLENTFITLKVEEQETNRFYEDGQQMEDDDLRDIIDEMRECRFTADKIAILHRHIHSLNDLAELLEECFYEDEFEEVYKLLNDMELAILWKRIIDVQEDEFSQDDDSIKEWMEALLTFIDSLGEEKKEEIKKQIN